MDLVTQTSLEALLFKAVNPINNCIDGAAVDAYCTIVKRKRDGYALGARVIAARLTSANESELLYSLELLNECMNRCGPLFQSEVAKFRFLNELIKLISPKYLGANTSDQVKQKVMQMVKDWTNKYPRETKIKQAYDMLSKLESNHEGSTNMIGDKMSSVYDDGKSRILKRLLQSKHPEDIEIANWLIKSMVSEASRLETIQNNARLLNDILNSNSWQCVNPDDLDLVEGLYGSCMKFQPTMSQLVEQARRSSDNHTLDKILQLSSELNNAMAKYEEILGDNRIDLVEFSTQASVQVACANTSSNGDKQTSDIDLLSDVFCYTNNSLTKDNEPQQNNTPVLSLLDSDVPSTNTNERTSNAFKELEELSQTLLKKNLRRNGDDLPLNGSNNSSNPNIESEKMEHLKVGDIDINWTELERMRLERDITLFTDSNKVQVEMRIYPLESDKSLRLLVVTVNNNNPEHDLQNYQLQILAPPAWKISVREPSGRHLCNLDSVNIETILQAIVIRHTERSEPPPDRDKRPTLIVSYSMNAETHTKTVDLDMLFDLCVGDKSKNKC